MELVSGAVDRLPVSIGIPFIAAMESGTASVVRSVFRLQLVPAISKAIPTETVTNRFRARVGE